MYAAAIVLAGGRSTRLGGVAKSGLTLNGQTLLERTLDAVSVAERIVVVGDVAVQDASAAGLPSPILVTREDPPFSGPAAAIAAGLDALRAAGAGLPDFIVVLACDMPGVADAVAALSAAATDLPPDSAGVIAVDDAGQRQLLAGIYRGAALLRAVERALESGPLDNLSVKRLLASLSLTELPLPADATQDIDTWDQAGAFGITEQAGQPARPVAPVAPGAPPASVSWREAMRLAAGVLQQGGVESVPLPAACGRVIFADLTAPQDVPHYASAAMDGWAVAGAGPWTIVASGGDTAEPGDGAARELEPGTAVPIVTGGLVPPGATAVLRSEYGVVELGLGSLGLGSTGQSEHPTGAGPASARLHLGQAAPPNELFAGQHIRAPGEETRRGEVIITAGSLLNPAHIAVAALAGYDDLGVIRRPKVRFIFTGNEVLQSGVPAPGRVRDAFGPQFPGLLRRMGAEVLGHVRAADTLASTVSALRGSIADTQIVITTGGTGHSSADYLREALHEMGARVLFDGVSMRPGGPTLLAEAPNGCLVACLPGNPLAAMIGLLTVVDPMVRASSGLRARQLHEVIVDSDLAGRPGTTILVPYTLVDSRAHPSAWRGSAMMRGIAEADGVLEVTAQGVLAGNRAWAITLPWT